MDITLHQHMIKAFFGVYVNAWRMWRGGGGGWSYEGGLMKGLRHRSTSRLDEINWQFTLSLSCVLHLTIRQ